MAPNNPHLTLHKSIPSESVLVPQSYYYKKSRVYLLPTIFRVENFTTQIQLQLVVTFLYHKRPHSSSNNIPQDHRPNSSCMVYQHTPQSNTPIDICIGKVAPMLRVDSMISQLQVPLDSPTKTTIIFLGGNIGQFFGGMSHIFSVSLVVL